jgi:hypothetical protein
MTSDGSRLRPAPLDRLFGLDVRSLAVFRVALALLLLSDLWLRSADLLAHYSDDGILPRWALVEQFLDPWQWSFHLASGRTLIQGGLFALAGVAALALLVGYRTRLATLVSWALLLSLQNRNPPLQTSGDVLFRLLLFWGSFLPLGACWSVDRALYGGDCPRRLCSTASMALTLQVCLVYWCGWLFKSDPVWRTEGTAVYYALSLDYMATGFGQHLLARPDLMKILTFAVLWLEGLGPFLLFIPGQRDLWRGLAVVLFISLHLGFRLGLQLGLFPFVCIAAWLVFIPSGFWEAWACRWSSSPGRASLRLHCDPGSPVSSRLAALIRTFLVLPADLVQPAADDQDSLELIRACGTWLVVVDGAGKRHVGWSGFRVLWAASPWGRMLPFVRHELFGAVLLRPCARLARPLARPLAWALGRLQPCRRLRLEASAAAEGLVLACLGLVLLWNLGALAPSAAAVPAPLARLSVALGLDQKWNMFASRPSADDGWYVVPGVLRSGAEVDVLRGSPVIDWAKPSSPGAYYPSMYWLKFMETLWLADHAGYRLHYGRYLCRQWNQGRAPDEQLVRFEIFFVHETTPPPGQTESHQTLSIWKHHCFDATQVSAGGERRGRPPEEGRRPGQSQRGAP